MSIKRFLVVAMALGLIGTAGLHAQEGPDDQYVRIYNLMQQAEDMRQMGQERQAYERLENALAALKDLRTTYPDWNPGLLQFRQRHIEERMAQFGPPPPAPGQPAAPGATGATTKLVEKPDAGDPAGAQQQIGQLTEQIQRLGADKAALEARLREALSAQPATVDPQQLARAEERIRELEKSNDLLKVNLEKARQGVQPPTDPSELKSAQDALAEAQAKLEQQRRLIADLSRERDVLATRVREARNLPPDLARLKEENESLKRQIESSRASIQAPAPAPQGETDPRVERLQAENEALRLQIVALQHTGAKPAKATAAPAVDPRLEQLQLENEVMRKELAELRLRAKTAAATAASTGSQSDQALARLQYENDLLKKELAALKKNAEGSARIKELQAERDRLRQQLEEANKKLNKADHSRSSQTTSRRDKTAEELYALQARLEVLEARKTPYTEEELALFKAPEPAVSAPRSPTDPVETAKDKPKRTMNDLPAGTGPLVAEAQRAFAARRYEEAEAKYQEVLRVDENNVYTLGNLAAIQLERNRHAEAEANLAKALRLDPDDAFNLSLWGILKIRQDKFDEALDALSRSAKLDPKNAETQNHLGIVLSQKGNREAAEAALRKALQLNPNYASAHHNLAVVYATQNPPFISLARYHYDKALKGGHPRNEELEKIFQEK